MTNPNFRHYRYRDDAPLSDGEQGVPSWGQREVSSLASFAALVLFIATVAVWAVVLR